MPPRKLKDIPSAFESYFFDILADMSDLRGMSRNTREKAKYTEAMKRLRKLHTSIKQELQAISEI
jgi:hypothetical protein